MGKSLVDIIVIGGSAGSIDVIISILKALPKKNQPPIVLVIHRMKNMVSHLDELLSRETGERKIIEPDDKEPIKTGMIYLAPQNYHLLVEKDHTFSLDYSAPLHFSRPSIDISFESIAFLFKQKTVAILLSGANSDGAVGLGKVIGNGGIAIIQAPETANYPAMPKAAISLNSSALIQTPEQILNCILHHINN